MPKAIENKDSIKDASTAYFQCLLHIMTLVVTNMYPISLFGYALKYGEC